MIWVKLTSLNKEFAKPWAIVFHARTAAITYTSNATDLAKCAANSYAQVAATALA